MTQDFCEFHKSMHENKKSDAYTMDLTLFLIYFWINAPNTNNFLAKKWFMMHENHSWKGKIRRRMDRKLQTSSTSNYFNSSTSICLCQWNFTLFFAHIQSVNLKTYLRTRVYSRDSHLAKRHQIRGFIFLLKRTGD